MTMTHKTKLRMHLMTLQGIISALDMLDTNGNIEDIKAQIIAAKETGKQASEEIKEAIKEYLNLTPTSQL